jgi:hypothetical protein
MNNFDSCKASELDFFFALIENFVAKYFALLWKARVNSFFYNLGSQIGASLILLGRVLMTF